MAAQSMSVTGDTSSEERSQSQQAWSDIIYPIVDSRKPSLGSRDRINKKSEHANRKQLYAQQFPLLKASLERNGEAERDHDVYFALCAIHAMTNLLHYAQGKCSTIGENITFAKYMETMTFGDQVGDTSTGPSQASAGKSTTSAATVGGPEGEDLQGGNIEEKKPEPEQKNRVNDEPLETENTATRELQPPSSSQTPQPPQVSIFGQVGEATATAAAAAASSSPPPASTSPNNALYAPCKFPSLQQAKDIISDAGKMVAMAGRATVGKAGGLLADAIKKSVTSKSKLLAQFIRNHPNHHAVLLFRQLVDHQAANLDPLTWHKSSKFLQAFQDFLKTPAGLQTRPIQEVYASTLPPPPEGEVQSAADGVEDDARMYLSPHAQQQLQAAPQLQAARSSSSSLASTLSSSSAQEGAPILHPIPLQGGGGVVFGVLTEDSSCDENQQKIRKKRKKRARWSCGSSGREEEEQGGRDPLPQTSSSFSSQHLPTPSSSSSSLHLVPEPPLQPRLAIGIFDDEPAPAPHPNSTFHSASLGSTSMPGSSASPAAPLRPFAPGSSSTPDLSEIEPSSAVTAILVLPSSSSESQLAPPSASSQGLLHPHPHRRHPYGSSASPSVSVSSASSSSNYSSMISCPPPPPTPSPTYLSSNLAPTPSADCRGSSTGASTSSVLVIPARPSSPTLVRNSLVSELTVLLAVDLYKVHKNWCRNPELVLRARRRAEITNARSRRSTSETQGDKDEKKEQSKDVSTTQEPGGEESSEGVDATSDCSLEDGEDEDSSTSTSASSSADSSDAPNGKSPFAPAPESPNNASSSVSPDLSGSSASLPYSAVSNLSSSGAL